MASAKRFARAGAFPSSKKNVLLVLLARANPCSFAKDDYMEFDAPMPTIVLDEGKRETHLTARGREDHCWYFVNEQKPDEVLIVRHWDIP